MMTITFRGRLLITFLTITLFSATTALAQQSQKKYYANGGLKAEVPVVSGIKQGIGKAYFEDGKPYYVVRYTNGQATDIEIYNEEGQLEYERQGLKGTFISYDFRGGQRKLDGSSVLDTVITDAIIEEVEQLFGK